MMMFKTSGLTFSSNQQLKLDLFVAHSDGKARPGQILVWNTLFHNVINSVLELLEGFFICRWHTGGILKSLYSQLTLQC